MKHKYFFIALIALTACTLEPKYSKPEVNVPLQTSESAAKKKITLAKWQDFFQSEDLRRVIQLALDNNKDLKIAALNIETAQATYGVSRSALLPTITATGYETRQGVPSAFAGFTPKRQFRANVGVSAYELDFFGRLRSLKKSALEDFLATEQARNIAKISLIAETVNAYSQLLLDSEILKIAAENAAAQSERYKFSELRYKNGIDSQSDLLNAQALTEAAATVHETYKKLVAQDKNTLMLLVGIFDEKSLPAQNVSLNDIKIDEDLLDFMTSETLLSRPDIKQAEHNLKAANASIGAARAAFFPSITLTGTYGYGSRELNSLLDSKTWIFTPQINLPIFTGGRNIANLDLANLRKKTEIVQYEKAIQTAFGEASDQLAEREAISKQVKSYEKIASARQKSFDISEAKHKQGISSALNILDGKIAMLNAKQNAASARKEYIANLAALYKVLGGGSEVVEEVKK